jgi:mRNA interferase RelE/StbE
MIRYESQVRKAIEKGLIPKKITQTIHNAFKSIELTQDLSLFDIKEMKGNYKRTYFRLRKGKYRAIFYMEEKDISVIHIGKRDEVYNLWQ